MKTSVTFLLLFLLAIRLHAQAPQAFDFQGIARNATGDVIANTNISLKLSIRSSTPIGPVVYTEKHQPTTSSGGIFTVSVGSGSGFNGLFQQIDWKSDKYYLQVEIDPTGGENYTNLGASQILSVPYALHAAEAARWKNDDPVVQSGIIEQGQISPDLEKGTHLVWYPREGAFRAGITDGAASWNSAKLKRGSVGFGINTEASGIYSTATGYYSVASGDVSIAMGANSKATGFGSAAILGGEASGVASIAFGSGTKAVGDGSFVAGHSAQALGSPAVALGYYTTAKAAGSVSIGSLNDDSDNPDPEKTQPDDRLFQIGNSDDFDKRSNAVTVLRNGNVGIGTDVLQPNFLLDIGAPARIRQSKNSLPGIYFDNSNNSPEGFVGLRKDTELGFFNNNKWLFWVDDNGNATISGSNYNSSDRRLKRNFTSLSSSLSKLSDLNGYHYFWKDSTLDQSLQTGLVAQEVETHFPELVKTDDKGFKSVNYTGLIPHLIESVKELKASVEYLQALNTSIKSQNESLKAQASELDSFRNELNTLKAATKQLTDLSTTSTKLEPVISTSNLSEK